MIGALKTFFDSVFFNYVPTVLCPLPWASVSWSRAFDLLFRFKFLACLHGECQIKLNTILWKYHVSLPKPYVVAWEV